MLKLSAREAVSALYKGILNRAPDDAYEHYVTEIEKKRIGLDDLISFFIRLPEVYTRIKFEENAANSIIASIYNYNEHKPLGNSFIWNENRLNLVHLHIPKTSGTTLNSLLSSYFHPLQLSPRNDSSESNKGNFSHYQKFFTSHMNLSEFNNIPNPKISITVLRNPLERIISMYRFMMQNSTSNSGIYLALYYDLKAMNRSITFQLTDNIKNAFDNHYVRLFSNKFATVNGDPFRDNPILSFKEALDNISLINFVLYTDKNNKLFSSSSNLAKLQQLHNLFSDLPFELNTHSLNITTNSDQLPEHLADSDFYKYDLMLIDALKLV